MDGLIFRFKDHPDDALLVRLLGEMCPLLDGVVKYGHLVSRLGYFLLLDLDHVGRVYSATCPALRFPTAYPIERQGSPPRWVTCGVEG